MSARQPPINLLPKSEFELSYWGRFLKWALTTGRYIVILTEIVVIAAFLSRFKFDQELADLTDEVNNKQDILKLTANTERNFRLVQRRMEAAAALVAKQNKPADVLDNIQAAMPQNVKLFSAAVGDGQATVAAAAGNELDAGAFLGQLAAQTHSDGTKKWTSVVLNELSTDSTGVRFSFAAYY